MLTLHILWTIHSLDRLYTISILSVIPSPMTITESILALHSLAARFIPLAAGDIVHIPAAIPHSFLVPAASTSLMFC
jgi:hypothetical protein